MNDARRMGGGKRIRDLDAIAQRIEQTKLVRGRTLDVAIRGKGATRTGSCQRRSSARYTLERP